MEEIRSLVVSGCRMAKELESNVLNAYGTGDLPDKCEEIAGIFTAACDRMRALQRCHMADDEAGASHLRWHPNLLAWQGEPNSLMPRGGASVGPSLSKGKDVVGHDLPSASGGGEHRKSPYVGVKRGGGDEDLSLQLTRTRKEENRKRTVEVAAPLHGNTDIPPDDGFTWRKYGQKEILNAQFPRAYYRCTHQKQYGCPAKKQVQRQNNNPHLYQVTYRGHHTCHTSSTAPVATPPPPPTATPGHHHDTSLLSWLSCMEIISSTGGGTMSTSTTTSGIAEAEYHATVVDMANAMFSNTINNAPNSIDFIFSKKEPQLGNNWRLP